MTALLLAVPLVASAETQVQVAGDKIGVRATASPISEVLDRIGSQTGMKIVYDGPPPRARVSLALAQVTPVAAVLGVLEGQGLNYILKMDATGTRVETLMLVGGPPGAAGPSAGPAPSRDRSPFNANANDNENDDAPEEEPAAEATPLPGTPGVPAEEDASHPRRAMPFQPGMVPQPQPTGVIGPAQPLTLMPPAPLATPPPGKVQQ